LPDSPSATLAPDVQDTALRPASRALACASSSFCRSDLT
jgi:hypothetical protein